MKKQVIAQAQPNWDGWADVQECEPLDTQPNRYAREQLIGQCGLPILIVLAPLLVGLGFALACWV